METTILVAKPKRVLATDLSYNVPSDIEKSSVIDIYSNITERFSETRYKAWPSTKKFIESLDPNSKVLEVGCGNGKNMLVRTDLNFEGIDACPNLVKLCQERGLNVNEGFATHLEYDSNIFDACISIAVIHHISTHDRRKQCVREMIRVLKEGGKIMIEVWDRSESKYTETKPYNNDIGDRMISFTNRDGSKFDRYYHFSDENEFKSMIDVEVDGFKIDGIIYNEKQNWIFIGTKVKI